MFILVAQVSLAKKLDVEGAAKKWLNEFAKYVADGVRA
jgi:hypothetical protein